MRSQRFLYEHDKKRPIQMIVYIGFRSWLIASIVALLGIIFGLLSKFHFGRNVLLKYPVFFSGGYVSFNGPSEARMEHSYFNMTFKATGWPSRV